MTHRLEALDPLAPLRPGPAGIVDVSEKVITGVPMHAALHYRAANGGPNAPSGELIADVMLRDADLRLARMSRARLLDLDARGVSLDGATAIEAQLSRVNLAGASMQGIDLQAALARHCDFSGANLAYARWHGATAVRCSFAGADLRDLSADRAAFLDCDLQGADLTVGEMGTRVTMVGAQFLRCDLRRSRWCNRTLTGVRFVRCKLHGVIGSPHLDGMIIDEPDLSMDGDGSWTGSLEEVLALWESASACAGLAGEAQHEEAS